MEKVILIFSFMDIGVNIISGKERVREEGRGGLGKRQINCSMYKFQSPFIRGNRDTSGRSGWWHRGGTQRSQRGLQAQTFPCPLLMGWQLLQPELPKSRACVWQGWGESDPLQDGIKFSRR